MYLGAEINCKNEISAEVLKRIMVGNQAYFANLKVFQSTLLWQATKIQLYKTLIRPIVSYSAETYALFTSTVNEIKNFEMKILKDWY